MDIKAIISQMTLDEKALMCSGKKFLGDSRYRKAWDTLNNFNRFPYGVVKRLFGFSEAVPATCFPTSSALASSWDVNLIYNVGKTIGVECQAEDPVLSGEIGAAFINRVQSEGVGACVKHYVGNNQEYHRQTVNNIIDERALNEIYLYNLVNNN